MGTALATIYIFFIGGFGGGAPRRASSPTRSASAAPSSSSACPSSDHRRAAAHERRALHPQRPLARRRGAARGEGRAPASATRRRRRSPRCRSPNIDFSYGPVQVLFDVGFEVQQGRDARAARHQRRRQVDDPARRSAGSRCPSAASCGSTAATSPTSSPEQRAKPRDHAAPRRQGRVPGDLTVRPEPGGERALV